MSRGRAVVAFLCSITLVASCGSPGPTPTTQPSAPLPSPYAASLAASPSPSPTATATPGSTTVPTPTPVVLAPGILAVTVSDNLVVRSKPGVSSASKVYLPYLRTGTDLRIMEGPVAASGYAWYHVGLVNLTLNGGVSEGWVAAAAHDGTPWIGASGVALAMSSVPRSAAPASEAKTAAAAINAFGLDLYKRVAKGAGNVVVSPASIAFALAMARAGAKGQTAAQMDAVMRSLGADNLAAALNALDRALAARNGTFNLYGETKGDVILRQANSVFAQRDLPIEGTFLDALASRFGAGVRLVDYKTDPEAARLLINAWVKQQTQGRIPELLTPGDVTDATRLALVNALYLKAPWYNPFQPEDTKAGSFTRLDGSRISVPMMNLAQCQGMGYCDLPYAAGSGWRAVELPLLADQELGGLAMMIIVPTNLSAFEKSLTPNVLAGIVGALRTQPPGQQSCADCQWTVYDVHVTMPRFGIDTRTDLATVLTAMGMPLAFDPNRADFTGIASPPEGPLFIKKVVHEASIDVDEKGVTASAATAVVMAAGGGPNTKTITFKVDRPFLFVVRDIPTGAVLFMGRVTDPSAG